MKQCYFCDEWASSRLASRKMVLAACLDCRSLAGFDGREGFQSPRTLAETILKAFDRRHRKMLSLPDWTSQELDALEDRLRQAVESTCDVRNVLLVRRANIRHRCYS